MTPTTAPTLTEYLHAAIEEVEAAARYCLTREPMSWGGQWFGDVQHYSLHDPAHVLAVCAAHKAIVETLAKRHRREGMLEPHEETILRALATAYADRPGWQDSWSA